MKNYAKLFANRNYKILAIVQFLTYFGAWFSQVGVYSMLIGFDFSGMGFWHLDDEAVRKMAISFSTAAAFAPVILLAPITGIIIDSLRGRRLLIFAVSVELLSVAGLFLIIDARFVLLLFLLIFIRLAVASLYFQTQMSILPSLLNKDDLKLANELFSVIWAVSYTAGMAVAGIFIHYFGVYAAFSIDCVLFFISILLLKRLDFAVSRVAFAKKRALIMAKSAIRYIKKNSKIKHLILLHGVVGITSYDALINYLASYDYFEKVSFFGSILSVALIIGLSNAVRAVALVIGPLVLSKFLSDKRLMICYFLQAFGIFAWAFTQFNFYLSFLGLFAAGFMTSSLWSYTYTSIQKACNKRYYGRVIAYVDMIYSGFSLAITILIGVLFSLGLSAKIITIFMGAVFVFAGIYWAIYHRRFN